MLLPFHLLDGPTTRFRIERPPRFDTATQADVFSAAAQIVLFVQAMKIGGQIRVVILLILIVT